MAPTGTIHQLSDSTFVWELQGFYQLVKRQDLGVHSPDFMYQGTTWDVAMYKTAKDAVHFTNFSLWRKSYTVLKPRLQVTYRLYIKDQRGKQYWWSAVASNEFDFEKREGTPQPLRDVDVLGYIYWNTTSNVFSLYVTFDSAQASLIKRTGSLRLPRRSSFINMLKRRGSFTQFENDQPENSCKSSEAEDQIQSKGRSRSANFPTTEEHEKAGQKGSFLSELKRRGSWMNMAAHYSDDSKDKTAPNASEIHKVSSESGTNLASKHATENHENFPQEELAMHDSLLFSFETVYQKQENRPEQKNPAEVDERKENERAGKSDESASANAIALTISSETEPSTSIEAIIKKINSLNVDSSVTFQNKLSSKNSSISPSNLDTASLANSANKDLSVFTLDFFENRSLTSMNTDSPTGEGLLNRSRNIIHSTNSPKDHTAVIHSAPTSEFGLKKTVPSSSMSNQTQAATRENLPDVLEFNRYPDASTIQQLSDVSQTNWPFNSSNDQLTTSTIQHLSDFSQTNWPFNSSSHQSTASSQPSSLFDSITASRRENPGDSPVTASIAKTANECQENPTRSSQLPCIKLDDITLSVRGRKMKAPRDVLASKSPVLADMIQRCKGSGSVVVDVPDVHAYVLQEFVQYLSTGDGAVLRKDNVADLYRVARQYAAQGLQRACVDFMARNVDAGVFCDYLTVALACPEPRLTDAMDGFFAANMADVVVSRQWKQFLVENPAGANQLLVSAVAAKKMSSLTARLASRNR